MAPPTILQHKSAFVTAQTLQLSQSLEPSPAWRNAHARSEGSLPDKALDDALFRLNHALQQHAKRVYASPASRHVAEQIEALFLEQGRPAASEDEDEDEAAGSSTGVLTLGADLTSDEAIAALPPAWDGARPPREGTERPSETGRYEELAAALSGLSARRRETRQRVERLRRMSGLLEPFRGGVQENLVTRNGQLEKELERMRVLLVRVAGRVAMLPDGGNDADTVMDGQNGAVEDLDVAERVKVEALLRDGF